MSHFGEPVGESSAESSSLARLVAECLDRVEEDGPASVAAFCDEHPEHADAIRGRIEALQQMGLVEVEARRDEVFPAEIGAFELIRRLGSGGMGVVYLAEQRPLGRTVALKLMRPDLAYFEGSRQRFQREVLAVARLHHPGIVAVHTAGEEGGIPFFAMEFVRGCSLAEALEALRPRQPSELSGAALCRAVAERSPLEDDDAPASVGWTDTNWTDVCLRLVLQVAEALAHAHEKGIHHRDIKPSNIMVTRSGRALLLDFGLASASDASRITRTGSHLGSLPYTAPEFFEAGPAVEGVAADVYSLGVTLYELLSLHCPFLDASTSMTIRKVLQAEPDPVRLRHRSVSWAAETVCGKAMDRDRTRRYASAEAFARDLRNALENRPIMARRPGVMLRARRWSRRHPARAVAIVAGVLLLGSSVTYGMLQRSTNLALTAASSQKDRALLALENRNDELDAALTEVDESFGRVVDAGIRMLSRVGFDILQNVPLSDSVRRDLLDEAQSLALVLQRDEPEDPHLRFEMARTLRLLGQFRSDMGEYEQGEAHLRQAVAILTRLVAEQPDDEEALGQLEQMVRSYHGLGSSLTRRSRPAQAVEALQTGAATGLEALTLLEGSGAPALTLAEFRTITAMNLQAAGVSLRFLGRLEEAEEAYREARALLALDTEAFDAEQQETLAVCCVNHSTVLLALGKEGEARAALRASIAEFQDMVRREPGNSGNRASLGKSMEYLAGLLPEGDPEALSLAEEAVDELRVARRDSPGSVEAAQGLAAALGRLGAEQAERELYAEAQDSQREAIDLLRSLVVGGRVGIPEQLVLAQTRLAECLVEADEYLAAEEIYREALAISEPWLADPNAELPRRSHTVTVLESFARFLEEVELLDEAAEHAHAALAESRRELDERPDDPRMLAMVSTTALLSVEIELSREDHAAARAVLESILEVPLTDEESLRAAALAAGCLAASAEDPELDEAERARVARSAVAISVAFLDRLEEPTALASSGALEGSGFDALRAQPGFVEWWSRHQ